MALLWGLTITSGVQYMKLNDGARNMLLTLGRYLQTVSVQDEGWGDGVLGAFGLKKNGISKRFVFVLCCKKQSNYMRLAPHRRRLLTRCLACIVFSLFPDSR